MLSSLKTKTRLVHAQTETPVPWHLPPLGCHVVDVCLSQSFLLLKLTSFVKAVFVQNVSCDSRVFLYNMTTQYSYSLQYADIEHRISS